MNLRLAPGAPLELALAFDAAQSRRPVGRLAMARRLAQLEWSPAIVAARLALSPGLYPPEPGLQAARSRDFEGLHGFLADSLPEGWGHLLMRRRLAGLGIRIQDLTPLERLALVGDRGRGALTFEPATAPQDAIESLDLDALAAEAAAMLVGEEGDLANTLARLGGGSGGARPKVHVGFDGEGHISVGEGEVAADHQAWIVKFPARDDPADIGPVEAAYAAMARVAGLAISDWRLIPARAGPGYFAARRFDRPAPGQRLHMLSLCGALEAPPEGSAVGYDDFLRATQAITRHAGDVAMAFRRMVFNILAGNRDDHTRQHSFLMDAAGDWRLAPAYDLTWSAGPGGEHYLDVAGEGRNPTGDHVRALGRRHGLSEGVVQATVEAVREAVSGWPALAAEYGATRRSAREIQADLEAIGRRYQAAH